MAELAKNDFWLSTHDLSSWFEQDIKTVLSEIENLGHKLSQKSFLPPHVVRSYLSSKGYQFPEKTISFQMLKGGVAKTTSALNFGWRASMLGCRVLFVDLDQQANLSYALGIEDESLPVWVDIIEKKCKISDAVKTIHEGLDLIPSSLNNSVLDRVLLGSNRNWAQAVKAPLKELAGVYDLIIIDTAPNLSAINTAVTCASDQIILPINPDKFSLLGLRKHLEDLKDLKKDFDLDFETKILFTKFDGRESSSRDFLSHCIDSFEDLLLKHYIRTSSEIKNSIRSRSLFANKSNAKEDYDMVTKEILGFINSANA